MWIPYITLAIFVIGILAEEPEKLKGASDAYQNEFPFVVSIRRNGNHHCGGAIVSSTLIITAAHCVQPLMYGNDYVVVVTGTNNLYYGGEAHRPLRYYHHAYYPGQYNSWNYDVGAIKLADPIQFNYAQRPIPITTSSPVYGDYATVIAWGSTWSPQTPVSSQLQKLSLQLISPNECQRYHTNQILPVHICTWRARGVGTCSGDSGSPLVYNGQLIGVVSGGIPCAVGVPDIFTDLYALQDFTNEVFYNS